MRLLLIAPTCDPDDVGESWVSAQWVTELSRRHDVTLLTYSKRDRSSFADSFPQARVVEWREPPLIGRAERLNSMLKPAYVPFYYKTRAWITRSLRSGNRFDIAHQISPVALRYPSPLSGFPIPYVLGPTGGSISPPPGFPLSEGSWYVRLRRFDQFRLRHDPMLRRSYARAGCVVGIGTYVRDILGTIELQRFMAMTDVGIESLPPPVDRSRRTGTVRVLFVGRLVRSKGALNAIRTMALLPDLAVHLDILGEGPDAAECAKLVGELGLDDRVTLHGRVPRDRVDDFYADADIFLFPSYREPGGLVVSEAMSHGLPCIVCARGGPSDTVDDTSGIRVLPEGEEGYERSLAAAVRLLVGDPTLRRSLGDGARKRIAEIGLWAKKADRMDRVYEDVLTASTTTPYGRHH